MAIDTLTIHGLRGFATRETLRVARPTGQIGSGLTIVLGPNNGGKSTIVEAFRAMTAASPPSFTEGKRNKQAGDRVEISIALDNGETLGLRTVAAGGSESERSATRQGGTPLPQGMTLFVLPSRRFFNPFFGRDNQDRVTYSQHYGFPQVRGEALGQFSGRLFKVLREREAFDRVLVKVLDPVPHWTIDQAEGGSYYLKINASGEYHTSDGLGEGIVSLFFVIDALYDSNEGEVVVIDEPELSLHPALQRKLASLLAEYSRDRQIIYCTHSPYFLDFNNVAAGAEVARVFKPAGTSVIRQLQRTTVERVTRFLSDQNNPHILGLYAREALFLEDGVILVEGQEDVVHFSRMINGMEPALSDHLYGWGVGGAGNLPVIAAMLSDLGFRRVAGILDANKASMLEDLRTSFPNYHFRTIPTDDVRTKPPVRQRDAVVGLLDENGTIREEHREETEALFRELAGYLLPKNADGLGSA